MSKSKIKIEEQQKQYTSASLEYMLCELLKKMCKQSSVTDELIYLDLDNPEMQIDKLAKLFIDYARKKAKSGFYGMNDEEAQKIITDFYKLPDDVKKQPELSQGIVSIFDLI